MIILTSLSLLQVATAASLPPCVGCDVENRLHHATQRIRVSEFFKDYDPLRTGFITSEQLKLKLKLKICRLGHGNEAGVEFQS